MLNPATRMFFGAYCSRSACRLLLFPIEIKAALHLQHYEPNPIHIPPHRCSHAKKVHAVFCVCGDRLRYFGEEKRILQKPPTLQWVSLDLHHKPLTGVNPRRRKEQGSLKKRWNRIYHQTHSSNLGCTINCGL